VSAGASWDREETKRKDPISLKGLSAQVNIFPHALRAKGFLKRVKPPFKVGEVALQLPPLCAVRVALPEKLQPHGDARA
jgi:hypothetical protein